jgi:hypothetical protein
MLSHVGGSGAQLCETRAAPSFADIQPEFHVANSPLRVQDYARGVQVGADPPRPLLQAEDSSAMHRHEVLVPIDNAPQLVRLRAYGSMPDTRCTRRFPHVAAA